VLWAVLTDPGRPGRPELRWCVNRPRHDASFQPGAGAIAGCVVQGVRAQWNALRADEQAVR